MAENKVTSNLHELEEQNGKSFSRVTQTPKGTKQRSPQSPNRTAEQLPVYNLRVRFHKTGRAQYISHLDLGRTMRTAINRAEIPVKYSEGFNPHPKMSFALTLSVGTESVCEFMELKLTEPPQCERIVASLRASLTEDLYVEDAYVPERKPSDIAWSEYEIVFSPEGDERVPDFSEIICDRPLVITKRTKSGEKTADIRPQILRFSQDGNRLTCVLCADNTNYLKPDYIAAMANVTDYTVMRRRVLLADGVTDFR